MLLYEMAEGKTIDIDEIAAEKIKEIAGFIEASDNYKFSDIQSWLSILKQIITAADLHRTNDRDTKSNLDTEESIYADYADDNEQFNAVDLSEQFAVKSVKWTIRVKALKLVRQLLHQYTTASPSKSPLLKHLGDLVRLSFVAATSPYDELKIQGFELFKSLINRFANIEEREFPGHSILEQYRTQIRSALKPAFNSDAPPYITAIACQVCCLWITRNVERDHDNLSRAYQLMKTTIDKLESQNVNQNSKLYTESELEQERLEILSSWAQLYIAAKESSQQELDKDFCASKLLDQLIEPEIELLTDKWWEALKDYALLIIPKSKMVDVPRDNEHVYTKEVALGLFESVWPKLTLASTIWLCKADNIIFDHAIGISALPKRDDVERTYLHAYKDKHLKFVCGILLKELCSYNNRADIRQESLPEATTLAIKSLSILLRNPGTAPIFINDLGIVREFYAALYRILAKLEQRCQHLALVKSVLDIMFKMAISREENPAVVLYIMSNIVHHINLDLDLLADLLGTEERLNELQATYLSLSIRIYNLSTIMERNLQLVTDQPEIKDATMKTFQRLLTFDADATVGTKFISRFRDIHSWGFSDQTKPYVKSLFRGKASVVINLSRTMYESTTATARMAQNMPLVEAYLSSMRRDIDFFMAKDSPETLKDYIGTLLKILPKNAETSPKPDAFAIRRNELLCFVLKCVNDLNEAYPEQFKASLEPEMEEIYNSALSLRAAIDSSRKEKLATQTAKKQSSTLCAPIKPQTKIVLKADFSNFYNNNKS